jgi:hypothetical protein
MRKTPDWHSKITPLLAAGQTLTEAARAVGVPLRTATRHLNAPGSVLAAMVTEAKAAQAGAVEDELGPLREKALGVLEKALDAGDLSAAKALLTKLVATPEPPPPEEREPEQEITAVDAAREVALALGTIGDLYRTGALSLEAVEQLRAAARAFLADDLRPRPPLDLVADRVDAGALAPEVSTQDRSAANGGAQIIPIRSA